MEKLSCGRSDRAKLEIVHWALTAGFLDLCEDFFCRELRECHSRNSRRRFWLRLAALWTSRLNRDSHPLFVSTIGFLG